MTTATNSESVVALLEDAGLRPELRNGVIYLTGYGQLWDEMPDGDIDLAHSRRHPSYCVDCSVAQYSNRLKARAAFVAEHQKDGHRVFDPLIDADPAIDAVGREQPDEAEVPILHPKLLEVDLDLIDDNPWQPRTTMDLVGLVELQNEIMAVGGLLQFPMARDRGGRYQLAFGHRRVEAVRGLHRAGKWGGTVLLRVQDLSDKQMAFIALTENRAREDLTPAEEISAWAKVLRDIEGVTIQSLADTVGVDRTTMSKNLAILDLPPSVLELVHTGKMSRRSARELLCLRNDDHCHEAMIDLVLLDLAGGAYGQRAGALPDYRLKTVRRSIRGLAGGNPAHGGANGFYEAQRGWRPLQPTSGPGGRGAISFDTKAFKTEHPGQVHVLPEGEDSGGTEWTCAVKQWASWSGRATREAGKSDNGKTAPAEASGGSHPLDAKDDEEWWKAVKRDPLVKEVVGKRLRAMKSPRDLTEEDLVLLGSRVERPGGDVNKLPQEAQPEGITLRPTDRVAGIPFFDYSQCGGCIEGAKWSIPAVWDTPRTPSLVCANAKLWTDKRSVAMQKWLVWKDGQVLLDYQADAQAILRLSLTDSRDAAALVRAMSEWFMRTSPVQLVSGSGRDWDERTRHNYWPAGAVDFAALTGLDLPDAVEDWRSERRWREDLTHWLESSGDLPGDFSWGMALACLQVWQARVVLGTGADIWGTVAVATAGSATPVDAAWEL